MTTSFVFEQAALDILTGDLLLSSGNYYAHLVAAAPTPAVDTAAGLTIPTTDGYAAKALTGLDDNAQRWTFAAFSFDTTIFSAIGPVGVVICRRAGASPALTDQTICYSDLRDDGGLSISAPVGRYIVSIEFGPDGAIKK